MLVACSPAAFGALLALEPPVGLSPARREASKSQRTQTEKKRTPTPNEAAPPTLRPTLSSAPPRRSSLGLAAALVALPLWQDLFGAVASVLRTHWRQLGQRPGPAAGLMQLVMVGLSRPIDSRAFLCCVRPSPPLSAAETLSLRRRRA